MADVIYSGGATDEQIVVSTSNGAERGVKTLAVSGDILYSGGATDTQVVVQTAGGAERAQKVFNLNSGGGGGGGSVAWGDIEGTLSNQTDLQTALNSKVQNTATGTNSLTILGVATDKTEAINIGGSSYAQGARAVAIGQNAIASGARSVALGYGASSSHQGSVAIGAGSSSYATAGAQNCIQIGNGTNTVANSFQVYDKQLLDGNGQIPADRINPVAELTTTSVELANNKIYNGSELASVTFTLPSTVPVNFTAQLNFTSGTTPTTFTAPAGVTFEGDACSNGTFTPVASKRYSVLIYSDGVNTLGLVMGN